MKYIAFIRKEPQTDFWVDAPDLPGCVSSGTTLDEAMDNFQQAITLYCESAASLPPPRSKDDIIAAESDPWLQAIWIELPIPSDQNPG